VSTFCAVLVERIRRRRPQTYNFRNYRHSDYTRKPVLSDPRHPSFYWPGLAAFNLSGANTGRPPGRATVSAATRYSTCARVATVAQVISWRYPNSEKDGPTTSATKNKLKHDRSWNSNYIYTSSQLEWQCMHGRNTLAPRLSGNTGCQHMIAAMRALHRVKSSGRARGAHARARGLAQRPRDAPLCAAASHPG